VVLGDRVELMLLPFGELVGVLPQRPTDSLKLMRSGWPGPATDPGLALRATATGLVPGFATHLVEGFGRPGDDVERVHRLHRVGAAPGDDVGDPPGGIGTDMGDLGTTLIAEEIEEPVHGRLVTPGRGPDRATSIVIDDDDQLPICAPSCRRSRRSRFAVTR
jgi:hypothetical protein